MLHNHKFNLYFTAYRKLCHILAAHDLVLHAVPDDGHIVRPQHVRVTFMYELLQYVGNNFTCIDIYSTYYMY